ncbi:unnamed protein product [Kuraishia capsulata CBS 1993]|uniref:Sm domain-containing protein n=1 Tax=Kuraishia capsulata CBS 1993 TaxID=1382522 RepID=W6MN03_9ASCO|nr:uncharacterized protein KUCA_T00002364001 [Kuraishia capsulata CBS 1993]CDK26392.1 unnamed protein product [Kuraishia capsulata CBS 1993]
MSEKFDPSAFLSKIIGQPVIVKLSSGLEFHGDLQSIDGFMNVVLEDTKEYNKGKLTKTYADAFIRGNNVMYISQA